MVFFVPAGSPPAVGHSLRAMLHTPYCWFDLALPAPVGGSQSRLFCVVADGWHKLVELSIQDACVKHSLAQQLGKDPAALRLQFTVPLVSDAVVQGYTCRGVLAVADSTTPSSHDLALVDCRPLLQGWHLFSFQDGRYSHAELTAELELFAPSQYHVQLEGAELDDDALLLVPGQVLTALFVPSSPAPSVEETESSHPTDDEPSADDSADDQDGPSDQDTTIAPAESDREHLFGEDARSHNGCRRSRRRSPRQSPQAPSSDITDPCRLASGAIQLSILAAAPQLATGSLCPGLEYGPYLGLDLTFGK